MRILLRYTHRAVFRVVFSTLVAVALLSGLVRFWLLPEIDAFRQTLESRLGALVGESVRIDKLSARLRGIQPEVQAQGLHILDRKGRSAVRFGTVRLNLATLRTLAAGEPRFDRIEIVGPRLSLRRNRDGSIAIVGLGPGEGQPTWLLADGRIDLRDAEILWQDAGSGAAPLSLGRVDLQLRNEAGRHRLSAAFALPKNLGRALRLAAEIDGDPLTGGGWRGRLYLEGQGIDLGTAAAAFRPAAFGVQDGRGDFRVWLDRSETRSRAVGDVRLKAPVFVHRPGAGVEHRLALKSLSSRFLFTPAADGWQLDLNGFRPAFHEPWPETRLALAVRHGADGGFASLAASASRLDVGDLAAAVQGLGLVAEEPTHLLWSVAPRGSLDSVRVFFAPDREQGERLAVCGDFRGLAATAFKKLPGFAGLGGRVCGTDAAGRLNLAVRGGSLDLTGIGMRPPMPVDRLDSELTWRQADNAWVLETEDLSARNPEIASQFRFHLAVPKSGTAPFLDLTARLTDVNVATLHHYAPRAFMPDTADWIERTLLAGNIPRWDILFRGFADQYPFYQHQGVFQSTIDIENLTFRFSRDWPQVTQAGVRFEFDGPTATVDASGGYVGTGRILNTHADVEDTFLGTWIRMNGEVQAGIPESMDFLAQSPLKKIAEKVRRLMTVSGDTTIAMAIQIPLDEKLGKFDLKGTANLENAAARSQHLDLALEQLNGPLHFDPDSLHAEGVAARFLDGPVTVDLSQDEDDIHLKVAGQAEVDRLKERFPGEVWRLAEGAAAYRLDLAIPESLDAHSAPLRLDLQSDLAGIALNLPAPLGKAAPGARPLALEARYQAGEPVPLRLSYGSDLTARLRLVEGDTGFKPEAGGLTLGFPLPPDDGRKGYTVAARLDEVDAGVWRSWLAGLGEGGPGGDGLREFRLQTRKLAWNGRDLGAVDLDFERDGSAWRGRIDGDRARGEVAVSPDLIRLDLDRLVLPDLAADKPSAAPAPPPPEPGAEPDPATLPPIKLQARRLLWNNVDFGTLALETERHAHGMILRKLNVTGRTHGLAVHGDWTRTPNRAPATRLEGTLHMGALGEFLALAGKPGKVRDTPADLAFKLDWPGGPQRFAVKTLGGELNLKLGKGSLPGIEPGLGRIIGVLNFNALWRRLTLDFSDLFGKGLAYDRIVGTFHIKEGQAVTDAFLIDAVSAKILMSGRIGLAARDMNQVVTVIPHTSAALPIAGVLVGGPAVGAALVVADQLIGEQVDRITASQYAVRGVWDDPVTTRIYRKLPLDVLDQAWSGVKKLSGFGSKKEEEKQ